MGNTSSSASKWDDLFHALTKPEELRDFLLRTSAAPPEQRSTLQLQCELLVGTLQVDVSLLKLSKVAESFDTATFCLGQLVSHEPKMMSELPFALSVVSGLSSALKKGWNVHHGVAKFAANALTIMCICEDAVLAVRELAVDELVAGLGQWLKLDDEPEELDEVCGCNCGSAALSATCWLERLLGKPDEVLQRKMRDHPALLSMIEDLLRVVSRKDGNPFALTRLLCTPSLLPCMLDAPHVRLASDALSFVIFAIEQFDNPAFTEDGVQSILSLLRHTNGCDAALEHEASIHMLEVLASASTYLPSAVAALEILASSNSGRTCLQSLGAKLSAEEPPLGSGSQQQQDATADTSAPHSDGNAVTSTDAGTNGAGMTLSGSNDPSSDSLLLSPTGTAISPQPSASSLVGGVSNGDRWGSDRRNLTSNAGGGARGTSWGIASALLNAGTFMRSLRGIVTLGAVNRRLSRAQLQLEGFSGVLLGEPQGEDTFAIDDATSGGSGGPQTLGSSGAGTSPALMSASDDEEDNLNDEESTDLDPDVDFGVEAPAPRGSTNEDAGSAGSVERWDAFLVSLHNTPTAADLVDPTRQHRTGIWEGRLSDGTNRKGSGAPGSDPVCASDDAASISHQPSFDADDSSSLPDWPNTQLHPDVVKAWVLLEIAGLRPGQEEKLLGRMTLAHKRIWLAHRLYREHHGSHIGDEDPILFVECTRDDTSGAVLKELRDQYNRNVGLGSDDLSGTLEVHFKDENSAGSAVRREWFSIVSDAFLDPRQHLMVSPDGGRSFRPAALHPLADDAPEASKMPKKDNAPVGRARSAISSDAEDSPRKAKSAGHDRSRESLLKDYEMLGRFIGLALIQQVTIGIRLHPSVCQLLLRGGSPWEYTYDDIAELDPLLLKHKVQYILNNDVEMLCLDFTDVLEDVGAANATDTAGTTMAAAERRVELKSGGTEIEVTNANKAEYVELVCRWRLMGSIEGPVNAMLRGLHVAVPAPIMAKLSTLVTPSDFASMLAGEPNIDLADWRRNCLTTGGLRRRSRRFRWFWRAVRSFSFEEREQLLQFVTGSRRPPVGGFAQLQGFNGGVHRFTLCAGTHEPRDSLPRAHACICTMDLPEYSSYAVLRRALHTAVTMGSVGFDDAAVAGGSSASDAEDDAGDNTTP